MFKYISEILSQFSMPQRIIALLVVLLSIIVITLGPSLINSITLDGDELWTTINKQKTQITELQDETFRLNQVIRDNQLECTNQIIDREREILEKLSFLENQMKMTQRRNLFIERNPIDGSNGIDTIQQTTIRILPDNNMEMMMKGIKDLKTDINKDIQNRGK